MLHAIRRCALVFAGLALLQIAGCAGLPGAEPPPAPPLADHLFKPAAERPDAAAVMAVDPSMRAFARQIRLSQRGHDSLQQALLQALYGSRELRLEYDSRITRNAAQAYADKAGNCLSLVLMTAAFARELGLEVQFNSALVDDQWRQEAGLLLRSNHVNLSLATAFGRPLGWRHEAHHTLMVDFLPPDELRGLRTRAISEAMVLAMYFNNRAVEALIASGPDQAYGFVREAIRQAPDFAPALNTLAVVYLRAGHLALADQTLTLLLAREADNTSALDNLAQVRDAQGLPAQASALRARRTQLEPQTPFQAQADGQRALRLGQPAQALQLFLRELARTGSSADLQFGLALAHHGLGQADQAEHALQLARDASADAAGRARYGAKIDWLRAQARR